jgi:hypothetical protein
MAMILALSPIVLGRPASSKNVGITDTNRERVMAKNKSKTPAVEFQIGDKVRVRRGIMDTDYPQWEMATVVPDFLTRINKCKKP